MLLSSMSTLNSSNALGGNCSNLNATMLSTVLNNPLLNRTAVIQFLMDSECKAELCSLAWGMPNPDLSGIGVGGLEIGCPSTLA